MPATMKHSFSNVAPPQIPRSMFRRPTGTLTAFDAGDLIPIFLDEILPGDTMEIDGNYLCRLQTLINPVFANLYLDVHFFFCPNRILWENWEKFMGASDNAGAQTTDYLIPQIDAEDLGAGGFASGDLGDFFGLPTQVTMPQADCPSALPFRMYVKIWNEWYRDQNLQNKLTELTDDGPDPLTTYTVHKRNKRKDYFTSALPYPQKGDAVAVPLGTTAPVIGDGNAIGFYDGTNHQYIAYDDAVGFDGYLRVGQTGGAIGGTGSLGTLPDARKRLGISSDGTNSHMFADISDASAITINALREAMGAKEGKNIPKGKLAEAAKKKGVTGQRARLAQTLASFNKKKKK